MRTNVDAHGDCMDTVRESALKADPKRKIPCRTRYLNPCQHCTWLFSQTLYQPSYPAPFKAQFLKTIQPCRPVVWHGLLATGTVGYRNSSTKPMQSVMLSSSLAWTVGYRNSSTKTIQSVMLSRTVGYRNSSTKTIQSVMLSRTAGYRNSSTKPIQSVMLSRTAGYRNSSMNSNGRMAISRVAPLTYQWEFCTLCIWRRSGMLPGKRWMTNSLHAPPHLSPGKKKKDTSSPSENNTPITW